jgi:hypothetical protein
MRVDDQIKKCVAFVALQKADKSYVFVGTVFFVARNNTENKHSYAITAKHVIEGIKSKGLEKVFLRVNLTTGQTGIIETEANQWIYHSDENVDIAAYSLRLTEVVDHVFYPETYFVDAEFIERFELDIGDEVFVTGLFKHHHGNTRNLPIIRIGNISSMVVEKIQTRDLIMDAYLIESRSIGGLSGSPVFTNLGIIRKLKGKIQYRPT